MCDRRQRREAGTNKYVEAKSALPPALEPGVYDYDRRGTSGGVIGVETPQLVGLRSGAMCKLWSSRFSVTSARSRRSNRSPI